MRVAVETLTTQVTPRFISRSEYDFLPFTTGEDTALPKRPDTALKKLANPGDGMLVGSVSFEVMQQKRHLVPSRVGYPKPMKR